MSRRFLITIVTILIVAIVAAIAIFLAKGYTISPTEKRIVGTGIISVTSVPDSASVYIDGHLTTATNANVSNLSPKEYTIRIVKEGFIPWERKVTVSEGLVTELKVTLFPAIPTVYPLTFNGVVNPILSPDGSKLAYIVPLKGEEASSAGQRLAPRRKAGVWVWTMSKNQPIAFARSSEPHQISQSDNLTDFSKAILKFSPNSQQVLASIVKDEIITNNFLMEADRFNDEPRDITPILDATMQSWQDDTQSKEESRIFTIKDLKIQKIASESAFLKWSPDETKFMARKEAIEKQKKDDSVSGIKIYDLEERGEYDLPEALMHIWLPDSQHVILVDKDTISVLDFDGTNRAIIYAGSFNTNSVFPWPDSSRVVFITSFPTPTASEPNFYGLNLR